MTNKAVFQSQGVHVLAGQKRTYSIKMQTFRIEQLGMSQKCYVAIHVDKIDSQNQGVLPLLWQETAEDKLT